MVKFIIPIIFLAILNFILIAMAITAKADEINLEPGNHYFTSSWCGACKRQAPIVKQLQDQGYDIQIYSDPKIFKNLNIKALPYFIIVKVNGTVVRLRGLQPIKKLVKVMVKSKIDIKIGNIEIKVN